MEGFLNYLGEKYFVKYDNVELKDMTISLQNCMKYFKENFNNNDNCAVKIDDILLCGSMSEHTSIWLGSHNYRIWTEDKHLINNMNIPVDFRCLEFDILAILKPLTSDMQTVATCPGHARISSCIENDHLSMNQLRREQSICGHVPFQCCCIEEAIFEKPFKTVRDEFHEGIISTAKKLVAENVILQEETSYGCFSLHFMDTYDDANPLFVWTSKNPSSSVSDVVGKIDLLPAFVTTHLDEPKYLVGKHCTDHMSPGICTTNGTCESDCTEQCWRVSHNNKEASSIRKTTSYHRDLYRIIKIFSDKVMRHQFLSTGLLNKDVSYSFKVPTSYHSKTILLHHIAECVDGNFEKCFEKIISNSKLYTEKGLIQNWEQTHSLRVEYFEIYFFFILEFIFSREKELLYTKLSECSVPLLPEVLDKIQRVKAMINEEREKLENTEQCLVDVLVFPLWDYAMAAISLNKDIFKYDKCDMELEKRAKVYGCQNQENEISNHETNLMRSHSEKHLDILVDYFSDENFNKNWENIFWELKFNGMPQQSFTRKIILEKEKSVYTVPEESVLPYDNSEKEMIKGVILEEEDYMYNRLLETFEQFESSLDLEKTFSDNK